MRFNVFEGARRIAILVAVVAIVGTAIALFTHDPYVSRSFEVAHPTGPFVRSDRQCPTEGGKHYFSTKTAKGQSASISLCLLPMPFGDKGEQLVPFKVDEKGMVWGARSYSSEVTAYERTLEMRFKLSSLDDQEITKQISREYRENMLSGIGYLALGLALFAAFVWTTGWIVRGFLGIPRGQDSRPSESPKQ